MARRGHGWRPACAALLLAGCTNADLYTARGVDPLRPDRIALEGTLCTDDTSGDRFPVKVLYLVDTSLDVFVADPSGMRLAGPPGSLDGILQRNRFQPHVRFGFVGVAAASRALPPPDGQRFFRPQDPEVAQALAALELPGGAARDVLNAIQQADAFIAADLARAAPGEVLRTRYLVQLVVAGPPEPDVPPGIPIAAVERLRERVLRAGALELRFSVAFLYYGPRTIDQGEQNHECHAAGGAADPPCACAPAVRGGADYCRVYCDVAAGVATEERAERARTLYGAMAFAGGGRLRELACPTRIDLGVDVAAAAVSLERKDIIAFNRNVRLTQDGPRADSDGDGLADDEELATTPPTDPTRADSDGDGLGDRVERRAFPRQDPLDPTDRPAACADPAILGAPPDRDFDLLNDCEEGLLQTSATIPDTDGDGLPDALEFLAGTLPTSADDRLLDFDADAVPNAREVLEHTDPRGDDGPWRGRESYRYHVEALGERTVATMSDVPELRGVTFRSASAGVAGGQALLRWDACARTLEWADARVNGSPPFVPVPVAVATSGVYTLSAQGTNGEMASVEVFVTVELLPDCSEIEEIIVHPHISVSPRRCFDVRITNIKLMETLPVEGDAEGGLNRILVFFTQAPLDRLGAPGIARVAELRVRLACTDPDDVTTCARNPRGAALRLTADRFVAAGQ